MDCVVEGNVFRVLAIVCRAGNEAQRPSVELIQPWFPSPALKQVIVVILLLITIMVHTDFRYGQYTIDLDICILTLNTAKIKYLRYLISYMVLEIECPVVDADAQKVPRESLIPSLP